jgi:hypothetical protein
VAVYEETLREVVSASERALANPDPWQGFTEHVTFLCELQATNRGLADLLTTSITGAVELEELRGLAHDGLVQITERAIRAGSLSPDFRPEDLVLLLMANAGLVHRTATEAPTAWRRMLGYTLNGLATPKVAPREPAPAADPAGVRRAMTDLASMGAAEPGHVASGRTGANPATTSRAGPAIDRASGAAAIAAHRAPSRAGPGTEAATATT